MKIDADGSVAHRGDVVIDGRQQLGAAASANDSATLDVSARGTQAHRNLKITALQTDSRMPDEPPPTRK